MNDRRDGKKLTPLPGFFAVYYQGLAKRAMELGYALAVHGTMARDLDLVAVPWFDDSKPEEDLVEALRDQVSGEIVEHPSPDVERQGAIRPHGRRVWSIQLGGGPYIDLSVMPRNAALSRLVHEERQAAAREAEECIPLETDRKGDYGDGWNGAVAVMRARYDAKFGIQEGGNGAIQK